MVKTTPKTTPMMEQYYSLKGKNRDSILLFRLGDFYEMFEKDAVAASKILNITLTKRNRTPMCGFPYHAAQSYIAKLLKEGKKIAICEQTGDPTQSKGIVKREIVEILSPGIITNPDFLTDSDYNCIAALYGYSDKSGVFAACASLDISTGEFLSNYFHDGDLVDTLLNEIEDNGIREIIYPESFDDDAVFRSILLKVKSLRPDVVLRGSADDDFHTTGAEDVLKSHFGVSNTRIFQLNDDLETVACGAVLSYVRENVKQDLSHIRWIKGKKKANVLVIDNTTKKHLELTENAEGNEQATLLSILDKTETAMGRRMLKKWLNNPSRKIGEIKNRLEKVNYFFNTAAVLKVMKRHLSKIMDIERIVSKLSVGKGNARDLIGLKNSLQSVGSIKEELANTAIMEDETDLLGDFKGILKTIESAIDDDPPPGVREGKIIKKGYSKKLDSLRKVNRENREWINHYQSEEQKKHKINSLKVKYNRIVGYFIEVTRPNLHLIPSYYIKKQTMLNSERFTTEELAEHETLLLEARRDADDLEYQIFEEICSEVLEHTTHLYKTSEIIAHIDVYCSLALVARENGYVMPGIVEENIIQIKDGRHPVVEKLNEEEFIGNDLDLNDAERRVMILTGPNMSGKSTYLRQSALIVIMAHMGSFIPAREACIGIVDRVFSRIGATDRLVKGESTFLVEMIETSRILHYATERSFIIMDEIGRGTSTYDGLSIAWAVLEYLLDVRKVGAKVLFATHYHEITALKDSYGIINYNATVKEWNDSVIFLRKIVPGSASKSYGIEVARMAGIPDQIVERSKSILSVLEMKYGVHIPLLLGDTEKESGQSVNEGALQPAQKAVQFDLFPSPYEILLKELRQVNIEKITPLEALNILDRLKKSISV